MNARQTWRFRFFIVLAGVTLGYAARIVLGVPESELTVPTRAFSEPLEEISIDDLPILPIDKDFEFDIPIEFPES